MKFCPKCGTKLRYRHVKMEAKSELALACDKCGYWEPVAKSATKAIVKETEQSTPIKVVGDKELEIKPMPTTNIECPKCHNNEAYWWFLQTRGGDEPTTQFYRCTKCEYTWRLYA
ncbi:MAG: transcription factor S [Nitrososphaerales archaeon]